MTSPERYKALDELTPAEMFAWRRDPSVRFETDTYREAKDEALTDAGFEPETKPLDFDSMNQEQLADLTPEQHYERITRPR